MSTLATSCREFECCGPSSLSAAARVNIADRLLTVVRDRLAVRASQRARPLVDYSAHTERVYQERAREARELAYQRTYLMRP